MNLKNRVQLIGNLGGNPEIREFKSNKKFAKFSVATVNIYKKEGKIVKDTQWHTVIVWDNLAEIAKLNLRTGTEVVIDGRLVRRSYKTKTGEKRFVSEVIAERMLFRNRNKVAVQTEINFDSKRA